MYEYNETVSLVRGGMCQLQVQPGCIKGDIKNAFLPLGFFMNSPSPSSLAMADVSECTDTRVRFRSGSCLYRRIDTALAVLCTSLPPRELQVGYRRSMGAMFRQRNFIRSVSHFSLSQR